MLLMGMVCLMTACQSSGSSKDTSPTSQEETMSSGQQEESTEEETMEEMKKEEKQDLKYKILSGTVTTSDDQNLTLQARDGKEYTLNIEGAHINVSNPDTLAGTAVVLAYSGETTNQNPNSAKAVEILNDEGVLSMDRVTGTIFGSTESEFSLHIDNEGDMTFRKNNCEGSTPDVLNTENEVEVKVTYLRVETEETVINYPLRIQKVK